jgi:rhamnulokinase
MEPPMTDPTAAVGPATGTSPGRTVREVSVAAVDLGATSGRVMVGHVGPGGIRLDPVARFPNQPVRIADGVHWNILELYRNVVAGLTAAVRDEPAVQTAGIDSWAVDYALLRGDRMLGTPFHYRDERTAAGVERVHARLSHRDLYARNGLQLLPFNTLYQLATDDLAAADAMLMIPDLIGFWLTGVRVAERTNASTTGLLDATTREWDDHVVTAVGLPRAILPRLVDPGAVIGPITADVPGSLQLVAVGSHDTASAVVAVPAASDDFAYISCGTWGLVGVEVERPVLTEAARGAGFTNELGVDGRVRFLHNVMGLWLLSESVREWERDGESADLPGLLARAAEVEAPRFDAEDPRFLAPGDMATRIAGWFVERGEQPPADRPHLVRSILESLAFAFASAVGEAARLSGVAVRVIHIVGGGSQNALLCRLTADLAGLPVLAGPVEATAIGNVLVQARALGAAPGSLEGLRALVSSSFSPQLYPPRTTTASRRTA